AGHAPPGPALGHGHGERAGATTDIEQLTVVGEFHEVEERTRKPTRPATEPVLVCGSVAGVKHRWGLLEHGLFLVQANSVNQVDRDGASRAVRGWLLRAFWRTPHVWGASPPNSCHSSDGYHL